MKLPVVLLISMLVVVHSEHAVRDLGDLANNVLAAAEPILTKLHLNDIVGTVVGDVTGFFKGKTGSIPVKGTPLTINYVSHLCHLKIGKRIIFPNLAEERCEAEACEHKITSTCQTCTKEHQGDAIECAVERELNHIKVLAKQAAAQQKQT